MSDILNLINSGDIIYENEDKTTKIVKIKFNGKFCAVKCANKKDPLFSEMHAMHKLKNHTIDSLPKLIKHGVINNIRYCIYPLYASINAEEIKLNFNKFNNDIIEALDYMHNLSSTKGVTHGDIKLTNIMKNNVNYILIDFETCRLFDINKKKKFMTDFINIGSSLYNSLDSMRGFRCVPRSDLQNFGFVLVSLYEKLPWENIECIDDIITLKENFITSNKYINFLIKNSLKYGERFVKENYILE